MHNTTTFNTGRMNGGIGALSAGKPTPVFPAGIAGDSKLAIAVDRLQTSLALVLDSAQTTMTVLSTAGIVANMLLSIDNEIVQVTAGPTGNQVPISRGFDGTSPALHLLGAAVSGFIDAYHHNTLVTEIEAIENALGPNLSHIPTSPLVVSDAFRFTAQTPGGSLIAGNNQITLTPVPLGVNGTDQNHYLYVSGGTGTPEAVLITGGSAVAGSPSGTLIIQCANTHSGAWTVQTASSGIQEAIISVGPVTSDYLARGTGGGVIFIPVGMHDVYAPVTLTSNVRLMGADSKSSIVRSNGTTIIRTLGSGLTGCVGCGIEHLLFDLNLQPNIVGLDLYGCMGGHFVDLAFTAGNQQPSIGIYMHGSTPPGPDYCLDCFFEHIHMEEGPVRCLVLHRTTLCSFRHMRLACDTGPVIDLVAATDTNYFYDVNIASGTANPGIYFNSSNTPATADFGVGSFHFHNVIFEGGNSGTAIVLGITDGNELQTIYGTWGTNWLIFVAGSTTNTRIRSIAGFGLPNKIAEWSSDGILIGEPNNPSWLAFGRSPLTLSNGANHNINLRYGTWCPIVGPTAAFSIGGFQGGVGGRMLYIFNESVQPMTILNQNAGSAAANQIYTLSGSDITLRAGRSAATFIYDSVLGGWILMSTN